MEIIGVGLILIVLAVAFGVLLRGSARGERRSGAPAAPGAGAGPDTAATSDPTADRPAGPAAETHMGPSPGVLHPESQHDADTRAAGEAPGPPPEDPPNHPNVES